LEGFYKKRKNTILVYLRKDKTYSFSNIYDNLNEHYLTYYIFYESLGIPKNIILSLRNLIKLNEINSEYINYGFFDNYIEKSILGYYMYNLIENEIVLMIIKQSGIYKSQILTIVVKYFDYLRNKDNFDKLNDLDITENILTSEIYKDFIELQKVSSLTEKNIIIILKIFLKEYTELNVYSENLNKTRMANSEE